MGWDTTSTFGSPDSSRASTTFCWLPPDSSRNGTSGDGVAISNRSISARASAAIRDRLSIPQRAIRRGSARIRFSATLRSSTQPEAWRSSGTTPTPAAAMAPGAPEATASPSTSTRPESSSSRLENSSVRAACPLPSTPATPRISPARSSKSSPSRRRRPSPPTAAAPTTRSTTSPAEYSATSWPASSSSRPSAEASVRSDTSRPTMARASVGGSASAVAISAATRPPRMMTTRSVAWRISSSLWLMSTTARCWSATMRRSTSKSRRDSARVSTDVGSSKMITAGSRRRHLMISTRWRWEASRSPMRASGSMTRS